jgi:hypothetical protein
VLVWVGLGERWQEVVGWAWNLDARLSNRDGVQTGEYDVVGGGEVVVARADNGRMSLLKGWLVVDVWWSSSDDLILAHL